jgi:hypothetical protein
MVGITPETAKHLKWKSLKWMIAKDHNQRILRHFLKHPFKYGWALLRSMLRTRPYLRQEGDFYLYNTSSMHAFQQALADKDALLVLGFSYCHKPLECPSGRFTDACIRDADHPVCRQCFIGKALHAMPDKTHPVIIPTIHYIGDKIFDIVHQHPKKRILFIITACEMTLKMFGDWGNMVGIQGLGVRLDGRICNTMEAFKLSEEGTKPGLTVVLPETQEQILALLKASSLSP